MNRNTRQSSADISFQLRRYNTARYNLIIIAVLTAINIFLLAIKNYTYFLFSASIPYIITDLAMYLCGMYPPEMYEAGTVFLPPVVFVIALAISAAIIVLYLLSYFLSSKRRVGWLIFALIFFIIDTAALFINYGINFSMFLDYAFHGWAIVSMFMGIAANNRMKDMPGEEIFIVSEEITEDREGSEENSEFEEGTEPETENTDANPEDTSTPLRPWDAGAKAKILLTYNLFGASVIYRRVGKTNELVIDGQVYGEYTALFERSHMLNCRFKGYDVAVGFDEAYSYIVINGKLAARKLRLV